MLNPQQKSAVEYLAGPLLVLAGPGTGKTQLLAHKVAHILESTDASPENILCLTFTEAGVTAMRERLFSMRVTSADRIHISTYHAFGSTVISEYKNYATSFTRVFDQPINSVAQYKLIRSFLQSLPANDILRSSDPSSLIPDLITTISEAKSARLTASDLALIAETNLADSAILNPLCNDILNHLVPRMKFDDAVATVYGPLRDLFAAHISEQPITGHIYREVNSLLLSLNAVLDEESAAAKPSIRPLSKWKDDHFEKDALGSYRLSNRIANLKLKSLAHVMQNYEQKLAELGKFDFSDMIQEAIHALQTDPGFKATLQERYQYILLDEFQDTNPSQFELVRLLSDYELPCIMAVGDDDQAIYAFQGANASNLLDFANLYNAKIITLTENYRSTSEVLDFSHQIADQITDSFAKNRGVAKILTSVRNLDLLDSRPASCLKSLTGDHPDCLISRHEFASPELEYSWVAAEITGLVAAGEPPSDIAIIAPKHKLLLPIIPYLKAKNLNISYEKRENVLEDPAIQQLTTLCRFIYELSENQNPSHRLLEILSFDFWHLDPVDTLTAVQSAPRSPREAFACLAESENSRLRSVATFLADLVAKSFDTPLSAFLQLIITKMTEPYSTSNNPTTTSAPTPAATPAIDTLSSSAQTSPTDASNQTALLYENLSVLNAALESYLETTKPRLSDFITFLDDYAAAGETILNSSPYRDDSNAIQVLSAHKSKGLEYKHVFLISVDSSSWGKGKGNNNRFTLPKNLESIRHTGITSDEQLRLLFVAITRAKLTLTMTNSRSNFSGKPSNRLEYLNEYAIDDHSIASPLLKNPDVVEHDAADLPAPDKQQTLAQSWLANFFTLQPSLMSLLQPHLDTYRLTASDLTTFIDIIYAGPLEFYKRKILCAPPEPATVSIHLGNLIHSTFEKVTNSRLSTKNSTTTPADTTASSAKDAATSFSDEDAIAFFCDEAAKLDLPESDLIYLTDRGRFSLTQSLRTFGPILRAPAARAEVNFSNEHLTLENIPLTGKIDHINIDESAKTIKVYDFKTGKYKPSKWESDASLFKYYLQLHFYKLLLNLSPTFSKYKVEVGHILFVSPDANGEVYDKPLIFTSASDQTFRSLVTKIYAHIQSLDFVSPDSPLHIPPDPTHTMKDLKEFLKLL